MTTLADIAREANCSVNLVSYVLKKNTPVKSEKHKQILEIANRLNYVSNKVASALITGRTNNVTLLLGGDYYRNLHQSFFIEYLHSLTKKFTEEGIGVTLYAAKENDEEQLKNIVLNGSSDGVIWYMAKIPDSLKQLIHERRYPSLMVLGQDEINDYINTDDYTSEYQALQYLFNCNHRRIVFVGENNSLRQKAYLDFMAVHQPDFIRLMDLSLTDFINRALLNQYLEKYGLDFTAMVFAQDSVAISVMYVMQNMGIRIPEDVSVIGYDDLPEAKSCIPALTTIRQDYDTLADNTVQYMLHHIQHREDATSYQQTFIQELVHRDSVRFLHD